MRVVAYFLIISCSFFFSTNPHISRRNTRHVTIEFVKSPQTSQQRFDWIEGIRSAIEDVNKSLRDKGHIAPDPKTLKVTSDGSLLSYIKQQFKSWYYHCFFHKKAIAYKGKINKAFITRRNDSIGSISVYIPDGVPEKVFIDLLRKKIIDHGVEATIEDDHHVVLTEAYAPLGYQLLDGNYLTLHSLSEIKKKSVVQLNKDMYNIIRPVHDLHFPGQPEVNKEKIFKYLTDGQKKAVNDLDALIIKKTKIDPYLFWWQKIPTTGMRLEEPFWPLTYPFLPHAFPLWQMAPSMGKGIKAFVIDSGIAAFDINWKPYYKKNQDLQMIGSFTDQPSYNLVSSLHDLLDPAEQLSQLVEAYTDKSKRDLAYIQSILPDWIRDYLKSKTTESVRKYLLENGKEDLITTSIDGSKTLSPEGERALNEIVQGESGFHTKGRDKANFTLVDIGPPNNIKDAILEFIPTAIVGEVPFNLFETSSTMLDQQWLASYSSGHGTHTSGIIGARLQPNIPKDLTVSSVAKLLKDDTGLAGIAPLCDLVMIKVFKSSGHVSNRSIVSQGIAKAQSMGAQIMNLSIKIDDQMDNSELEVKSLQKALEKVPYVSAASGNAYKETNGYYQADREGYPARFASVSFDVGAFSYYQDSFTQEYLCPIPSFSQYQEGIGPKFVAPGQNILSCGLIPDQQESSVYVFMEGTSAAAPMISGFNALMLSEFQNIFTINQRTKFLTLCYTSALRMHNDDDWQKKTLLGALDFRTVLFKLHVLKRLKEASEKNSISYTLNNKTTQTLDFENDFERLAEAVHRVLFGMPNHFARMQKISSDFANDFMGYFNVAKRKNIIQQKEIFNSFDKALSFVSDTVLYAINPSFGTQPNSDLLDTITFTSVQDVFKQETIDIFGHLSGIAQRRIKSVDANFNKGVE